jgi:hypothetical protein
MTFTFTLRLRLRLNVANANLPFQKRSLLRQSGCIMENPSFAQELVTQHPIVSNNDLWAFCENGDQPIEHFSGLTEKPTRCSESRFLSSNPLGFFRRDRTSLRLGLGLDMIVCLIDDLCCSCLPRLSLDSNDSSFEHVLSRHSSFSVVHQV